MPSLSRRNLLIAGAAGAAAATAGAAPAAAAPGSTGHPGITGAGPAAGQPFAPNWFPADIATWSPDTDPDARFNRSTTPLTSRIVDRHTTANAEARKRRILALSVFANTDGNPSQGSARFDYYTSEFWQYIDSLVFWGGSASEGLILAPNPTVTDAAHRNGVPVHGTVFFPPNVYGGDLDWVRQFLRRDALGRFPVADGLARISRYFGFEGWFINQETTGADPALAEEMRLFVVALKSQSSVIWYDAMNTTGAVGWRGRLDELNAPYFATSDTMFVDFRWDYPDLPSSATYARGMGRDPGQLFCGVDTGWRQYKVQLDFDAVFPADDPNQLSIGLYRPDFTLTSTDDKSAYEAREQRFWVGADGDPSTSTADADGWKGVSSKVAEAAVVTRAPFATTFNTGHGRLWASDGRVWQRGEWNNLTAQDVLPTWRWLVTGSALTVGYDYEKVWEGGSSLRLTGVLGAPTRVDLYATRVRLTAGDRISLTATAAPGVRISALVRFLDAPDTDVEVPLGLFGDRWTTRESGLSRFHGRTLIRIALRISGTPGATAIHIGRLALEAAGDREPRPVRGVRVDGNRITWPGGAGSYDVLAVDRHGARTWLGRTTSTAFYAPTIPAATKIEVLAR
ncbi:glycoside hydrolase [Longispora sp. K20-0274]|uniref:endo-beta-N-acetylglucosaminidase n=1 Tax=Longispora sp. K20-0274 TaxID=3088255 RepID=UPI00399AA056